MSGTRCSRNFTLVAYYCELFHIICSVTCEDSEQFTNTFAFKWCSGVHETFTGCS